MERWRRLARLRSIGEGRGPTKTLSVSGVGALDGKIIDPAALRPGYIRPYSLPQPRTLFFIVVFL